MTAHTRLEDTTLAALISSKICHDLAGQIGAINNGLELLEEENDEDTRYYALELIHNSAKAAWAQLDFNRLAFGVSSGLGAVVPWSYRAGRPAIYRKRQAQAALAVQRARARQGACKAFGRRHRCRAHGAAIGRRYLCGACRGTAAGRGSSRFKLAIVCRGTRCAHPEGIAEIFAGKDFPRRWTESSSSLTTRRAWRPKPAAKSRPSKTARTCCYTVEPK